MKRQVRNAATQDLEVARLESMRLWLEVLKKHPDFAEGIASTFRPGLSAHEKIFHGGRQAARRGDAHGEHLRQQDRRPRRRGGQMLSRLETAASELAGDDELLDLAGSLVDAEQPCVPVEPLNGHAAHVARPAVDLHGAVGDPADHL